MKNNKVYRKDGELIVQFQFEHTSSMLDMEEQIEALLGAIEEPISKLEQMSIRSQLLSAFKDVKKETLV